MKDNQLDTFDGNESLKAFAVALSRCIAAYPDSLLEFHKRRPVHGNGWLELYEALQDKDSLAHFSAKLEETAKNYDWSHIESVFVDWGKHGWVVDSHLGELGFWDELPNTVEEADQKILAKIDDAYLAKLRNDLESRTGNQTMLREALFCLDNECYYACASLLTSLIDGTLISSPYNDNTKNRKTGEGAGKKIINELIKDDFLGLPGLFNLEIKNFNSFISTFFERANGFFFEPSNLNRNYIQHGMSNRSITHLDCIKLLIAYRKTIAFAASSKPKEG